MIFSAGGCGGGGNVRILEADGKHCGNGRELETARRPSPWGRGNL